MECRCECGRTKTVSLWDLRSGKTKTCGLNHPFYEDRSRPAFNTIYRDAYRKRALKVGLAFTINEQEFRELTQRSCHYCGSAPSSISMVRGSRNAKRGQKRTGTLLSQYIYNGLDRIDSAKGYTLDNVVPCYGVCNHAKHTMPYDEFVAWLDRVAEFRTKEHSMKKQCEFCPPDAKPIDTRGMPAHIHFRHRRELLAKFAADPRVRAQLAIANIGCAIAGTEPRQLSAAPAGVEAAITEYQNLEDQLALDLMTRGITSADIVAGVRLLIELEEAMHVCDVYWSVWEVPIWQKVDAA